MDYVLVWALDTVPWVLSYLNVRIRAVDTYEISWSIGGFNTVNSVRFFWCYMIKLYFYPATECHGPLKWGKQQSWAFNTVGPEGLLKGTWLGPEPNKSGPGPSAHGSLPVLHYKIFKWNGRVFPAHIQFQSNYIISCLLEIQKRPQIDVNILQLLINILDFKCSGNFFCFFFLVCQPQLACSLPFEEPWPATSRYIALF